MNSMVKTESNRRQVKNLRHDTSLFCYINNVIQDQNFVVVWTATKLRQCHVSRLQRRDQKIKVEEVLERFGEKRTFLITIKKRNRNRIGYGENAY